jgi:hypothetical protein
MTHHHSLQRLTTFQPSFSGCGTLAFLGDHGGYDGVNHEPADIAVHTARARQRVLHRGLALPFTPDRVHKGQRRRHARARPRAEEDGPSEEDGLKSSRSGSSSAAPRLTAGEKCDAAELSGALWVPKAPLAVRWEAEGGRGGGEVVGLRGEEGLPVAEGPTVAEGWVGFGGGGGELMVTMMHLLYHLCFMVGLEEERPSSINHAYPWIVTPLSKLNGRRKEM